MLSRVQDYPSFIKEENHICHNKLPPKSDRSASPSSAMLAGVAAVLAGIHALQALGISPDLIGPVKLHSANLWNAFMWGLLVLGLCWADQDALVGRSPGVAVGGHHRVQPRPRFHGDAGIGRVVGRQRFLPSQCTHLDLHHAAGCQEGVRHCEVTTLPPAGGACRDGHGSVLTLAQVTVRDRKRNPYREQP